MLSTINFIVCWFQPSIDVGHRETKAMVHSGKKSVSFEMSNTPEASFEVNHSWTSGLQVSGRPKRYTTEEKVEDKVAAFWDKVNKINNGITVSCLKNIFSQHNILNNRKFWSNVYAFVSGAGGLWFKFHAGQMGHSVANDNLQPLRHFLDSSCVAMVQWRANSLHASV